jgi:hypothetical protein
VSGPSVRSVRPRNPPPGTTPVELGEPSHGLDYLLVDFKSLLRKAPDGGPSATKVRDPVADKK